MEMSARELRRMAAAVDEQHREGMATMAADVAELHAETRRFRAQSRRSLLRNAAMGAGAVTIGGSVLSFASLLPAAAQEKEPELADDDIAAFAESVELAAVEAYAAAAATGKLDPPVVEVGTMFAGHHAEHAKAFGGAAGAKATGRANVKLLEAVAGQLKAAKDQKSVLQVAYDLENAAVGTYMFAVGALKSQAALALTASILPVESQHAVVLGTALAKPPADVVPPFETAEKAIDPSKFPASK
ncbi:MAG: ferritin-like domain-containing protein [Actinobacteria bacterium]|nr:ferritin-like domain-containing protein [Actinomycetota bacterium]MBW3650899.1 ferritin-like domain-containing protein [Actinomycetota bacterium]